MNNNGILKVEEGENTMNDEKNIDFTFEKVEIAASEMNMADVQAGCWGDSGSDWANNC